MSVRFRGGRGRWYELKPRVDWSLWALIAMVFGFSWGEVPLILCASAALFGPKDIVIIGRAAGRLTGKAVGYIQSARGHIAPIMQRLEISIEGSVLKEQQQNGRNGQGQPRTSVDASSLQNVSENFEGSLVIGKHGSGAINGSCEGSAVGSGEMVRAPVVAKASERRELMSPGNAVTFAAWGSVTCAMAACFSPGVTVLQQTPGKDWLQDFDTSNIFASSRFTSPRFASPTAIWRSPFRLDPFPSTQKEEALLFMDGLEIPPEDGVDDALGLMRHSNENNNPAYSEAEEVLAKHPSGQPMPSPLSGYRLRPISSRNAHSMKENRSLMENDGGGSTSVNWLLPSPEHGITKTLVRGAMF